MNTEYALTLDNNNSEFYILGTRTARPIASSTCKQHDNETVKITDTSIFVFNTNRNAQIVRAQETKREQISIRNSVSSVFVHWCISNLKLSIAAFLKYSTCYVHSFQSLKLFQDKNINVGNVQYPFSVRCFYATRMSQKSASSRLFSTFFIPLPFAPNCATYFGAFCLQRWYTFRFGQQ